MKRLDIRFNHETIEMLQSLIGAKMEELFYERLDYTTDVYGMVAFRINNKLYRITNCFEVLDYMDRIDDVGVFKFGETNDSEIEAFTESAPLTHIPVHQRIVEIHIMNENQQLYCKGIQTYNVDTVRGIVFVLEDGREVSLEKEIWFSELIDVKTGHDLMQQYNSMDDFLDNWEEFPEYEPKGSRSIIILK